MVQPNQLKIGAIFAVVVLSADSLPSAVVMVNERSDEPLFGKDVRTDDAKNFTHSNIMTSRPNVRNGSKAAVSGTQQIRCPTADHLCLAARLWTRPLSAHSARHRLRPRVGLAPVSPWSSPSFAGDVSPSTAHRAPGRQHRRVTKWRKWKTPRFQAVRVTPCLPPLAKRNLSQ